MTTRSHYFALFSIALLIACTDSPTTSPDAAVDARTDMATTDADPTVQDPNDCDPLVEEVCAMPWPSNLYLRPMASRPTGYALQFGRTSLPQTSSGDFVDGSSLQSMDGYGLGTPIMAVFPNLDVTTLPNETRMEQSMAADASALLFEVSGTTLRRVPYWTELDAREPDASMRTLFLRPAMILKEATRYVVAFRGLRNTMGTTVPATRAFAALRDNMTTNDARLAPRQARFSEMFQLLEGAGITRQSLTLAWDFNTASSATLHGRLLAMRDDALMRVGTMGPALTLDTDGIRTFLRTDDGSMRPFDSNIALELNGTIEVPDYTVERQYSKSVGRELNLDAMGRPVAMGTRRVPFWVRVPHSALGGEPHGIVLYGHGLLGSGEEVRSDHLGRLANTHRLIIVSANLSGMSGEDVPAVFAALRNMSYFRAIGQRLHQGLVQWVLLARAMRERLGALPVMMSNNVRVNREELFYSGNSQGGIFGGTFMAISPDVTRGHLGVPGNNYSTLLHRSSDFDGYFAVLRMRYEIPADLNVVLGVAQLHWDGTDPVNYLHHIHQQPFPGNTPHEVILGPAKGDYQVSVLTNEIAARSDIGIPLMANYDRERSPWNCPPAPYPHRGSGVVLFDFGNPWPMPGNVTPTRSMVGDPHERPRRQEAHQRQIANFFRTGEIIDVCGGDGCRPD
jgi:hypothetical protein